MKEGQIISVKWIPSDALDGTQVLAPMEELAYRRIIDLIYVTEDNLINDDKKLAWMTKTGRQWKAIKTSLIALGKIYVSDNRICNAKCKITLQATRKLIEQKRSAGKASAEQRKLLENNDSASTDVDQPLQRTPDGKANGDPNEPSTSHKPLANSKKESKEVSKESTAQQEAAREKSPFQRVLEYGAALWPILEGINTDPIRQWLQHGCDVEADIIPTLERKRGIDVRSWNFFTNAISEAKTTRLSPLPKPFNNRKQSHGKFEQQDYRAGTDGFEVVGGEPDNSRIESSNKTG